MKIIIKKRCIYLIFTYNFLFINDKNKNMNEQSTTPILIESEESDVPLLVNNISLNNFINNNFLNTTIEDWNDWNWQIKNSITNVEKLTKILKNKEDNIIFDLPKNHLPFRITPYFTYLLSTLPNNHPLCKTVIPTIHELDLSEGEKEDSLDERKYSPVSNIVHKYPDRALFLVTNFCSINCRFCSRSYAVSKKNSIISSEKEWEKGFQYIKNNKNIRDVIISGGDPLTLRDDQIEYILKKLRSIEHVEIIRIGTKTPVVLPMRITTELTNILKKYHPLFINIHFTHPDELTIETQKACNMLADAGISLGSQSVLLKNINDNKEIFRKLYKSLLKLRVKPYYIFSCDKIPGSKHFQSPISKGLEIIDSLRGHTSGLACPQFVVDSNIGKISLLPDFIKSIKETEEKKIYSFRNYNNIEIFVEDFK